MTIKNQSALNEELHGLALKADSYSKTIIHRDFQSQNIMITKGNAPRVIDYQGARIGPPAYDIASILWDPYHRLDDSMRERLLNYYTEKIRETHSPIHPETLIICCLQRHMQALGAYAFLSKIKGKKYFFKYIPEGLRLLKEDISVLKQEYPVLHKLIIGL
jgi:aminoglycoside/choline kinase family phosphotransferase